MLKTFPGWLPFREEKRDMALLPSPQTLCIFGYTFSRQDAMAAVRTTLASAVPLIMYFDKLSFMLQGAPLAPFVPFVVMLIMSLFSTTGGIVYTFYLGSASFLLALLTAVIIMPLSTGQPWLAVALALLVVSLAAFFWSWVDPTKRSITFLRLYALLTLMIANTTSYHVLQAVLIFISVLWASCLAVAWFSVPLALFVPRNIATALYNCGVLVHVATQSLESRALKEGLPAFDSHAIPNLSALRVVHDHHVEDVAFTMREMPFEMTYASTEAAIAPRLFRAFSQFNDCTTSVTTSAQLGVAFNLSSAHWRVLTPKVDAYMKEMRDFIAVVNSGLLSMYSGSGQVLDVEDVKKRCNQARQALLDAYTEEIKIGNVIEGVEENAAVAIDHWMLQLAQLHTALSSFSDVVRDLTKNTSSKGWLWLVGYYTRALLSPLYLLLAHSLFFLRSILHLCLAPFVAIYEAFTSERTGSQHQAHAVSTPAPSPNLPSASSSTAATMPHAGGAVSAQSPSQIATSPNSQKSKKQTRAQLMNASSPPAKENAASVVIPMPVYSMANTSPASSPPLAVTKSKKRSPFHYEKHAQALWNKSLLDSAPPTSSWADYVRDGHWKTPIRFILVVVPVTLLSMAFLFYWEPKINVPWAITSAIIVISPTVGMTWRRFAHRALGTFVGALLGQITVVVANQTHRFVAFGPLIVIVFVSTFFHNDRFARHSYFWMVNVLTYGVVVISAWPFTEASWKLASYRFLMVLIGALIASLGSFILPEWSSSRFLSVVRAAVAGSHKAVLHIHHVLSQQHTPLDLPMLESLGGSVTLLQGQALALRYDAASEYPFNADRANAIRLLRYKTRDLAYAVRMLNLSMKQGAGQTIEPFGPLFYATAQSIYDDLAKEAKYIDEQLKEDKNVSLDVTTEKMRNSFIELEAKAPAIKDALSPLRRLQVSSHLTLFRYYSVVINDIARIAECSFQK